MALLATAAFGFVCPPCGDPPHPACPPADLDVGAKCGSACNTHGTCREGLTCVTMPSRIGGRRFFSSAMLIPSPAGTCQPAPCEATEDEEPCPGSARAAERTSAAPAAGCAGLPATFMPCAPDSPWPSSCCHGKYAATLKRMCATPDVMPAGVCRNATVPREQPTPRAEQAPREGPTERAEPTLQLAEFIL